MSSRKHGRGVVNSLINKLPFELHLPKYEFCGPGTRLHKRLARGDQGINPLDKACREHDIAYNIRQTELEQRAWERVKSKDAKLGEKAAAWAITNAMKVKRKLGMGCRKKIGFRKALLANTTKLLKKNSNHDIKKDSAMMVRAARMAVKNAGGRKKIKTPRILPLPKTGGILPLIPIFAGLSALGALSGGAAAVARTVIDAKKSKEKLEEAQRHNKTMEAIALGKQGSGLYMKPYKSGYGLGVFMRDCLPSKPRRYESAILNLDSEEGPGTHWVAYKKTGDSILYFDSFGSLKPPIELVRYFNPYKIRYNPDSYQTYNTNFSIKVINIMSHIFTVRGRSSILSVDFNNPIELDPKYNYSLALIGFHTYNSIPNIESGVNNKFYYWELVGSYEISDIEAYLQKRVVPSGAKQQSDSYFSLKPNNNTLKCEIKSKHEINFTPKDSLAALLGYSAQVLKPDTLYQSDLPVNIVKVVTIHVDCNITTGAFYNNRPSHTIFEFGLKVDPGYAIDIEPNNLIFLPVNSSKSEIDNITLKILDQNSEPVNFRGEEIIVRLELRRQ
ncbi:hypothetical protein NQ317_009580 [Molorchus minor]|uniref:Phospholipase A2-like domain-containing protein n=1 Tax=Molorchus minor TaxID=1323400 RepID=A0ABQ9IZA2_9CUCU|nr:hypothetical protein NQ317_009580 [Molorchus minor]